jgi:thioredoxin-related protein
MMKKFLLTIALATATIFTASCGEKEELPAFSTKYNQNADPATDIDYAVKIAQEEGKRILLEVGGDWCPWCNAFDKFKEDKSDVADYINDNFVLVKIYYGPGNYNNKFLSGMPRLVATPHFYVLESDGTTLVSQGSEELEKGRSYDRLKVMSFLQQWTKKKK